MPRLNAFVVAFLELVLRVYEKLSRFLERISHVCR